MAKLTPKQQRFVEEYCVDFNGTQAAIRAGYSPRTANEQAAQLLAKLSIQEAVRLEREKISLRVELTQDEVIAGLRSEARYYGETAAHSARVKAWELLGKHRGMFPEKHHHGGDPDNQTPIAIVRVPTKKPANADNQPAA